MREENRTRALKSAKNKYEMNKMKMREVGDNIQILI